MKSVMRDMKEDEFEELEAIISWPVLSARIFMFAFSGLVIGAVFFWLNSVLFFRNVAWWPFATMGGLVFLYIKTERWTGGRNRRRNVRNDIEKGKVVEASYTMKNVVKFPEIEDEGLVYFFEDDDGELFCISGQEVSSLELKGFPRKTLSIIKGPESGHIVKIEVKGEKVISELATVPFWHTRLAQSFKPKEVLEEAPFSLEDIRKAVRVTH